MSASTDRTALHFNGFELRLAERQLRIDGTPAKLGARAFDVLAALAERRGRTVSKNELLELVWPDVVVEENNLQVQVSALRKLLGAQAIATIPGRGYRFTAALDDQQPSSEARSPVDEPRAAPAPSSATTSGREAPGNLPPHLTPLIARDAELQALIAMIEAHPLVTVLGAAGMGKTVLAQAAAHALRRHWPDGAWWVELAPVSDPAQLPQAVAQALRLSLGGDEPPQQQLLGSLRSQQLLLVLDNCEHLVDAAAALAEAIVTQAPGVRLLATSQELLNVPHETIVKLGALAVPPADETSSDSGRYGAVQLFAERARAADPRFVLDETHAGAVADICRHLDGLPLAIELAAARTRLLGVQGLRERLGERFRVLTGGARTAMRRHQTLHAAIDWSHALLSVDEQTVLRRLGVFVGGFTIELAQQVACDESLDDWAVLDALSGLVDKSLVAADDGEPPRYRLLETTRAYALEKLADAGETAAWIRRHAQAMHHLFVQVEDQRFGEQGTLGMADFLDRLAPELDNARAALDWAVGEACAGDAGGPALAVGLVGAAAEVFRQLGLSHEALHRMRPLAQRLADDWHDQVDGLSTAMFSNHFAALGSNGRLPKATMLEAAARAEAAYRQRGLPGRLHHALCVKAWALNMLGQPDEAEALLAEVAMLEDTVGAVVWRRALRLNVHAAICDHRGRFEQALAMLLEIKSLLEQDAREAAGLLTCHSNLGLALVSLQRYEEALALVRPLLDPDDGAGRRNDGYLLSHLLTSLTFLGRLDEADEAVRRAIPAWRRDSQMFCEGHGVALWLAERGRHADAARVRGAVLHYLRRSGMVEIPLMKRAWQRMAQLQAAAQCTPADIERWQREGESLDEAAVAALALRQ